MKDESNAALRFFCTVKGISQERHNVYTQGAQLRPSCLLVECACCVQLLYQFPNLQIIHGLHRICISNGCSWPVAVVDRLNPQPTAAPENSKLPNRKLHALSPPCKSFPIHQTFAAMPKCNRGIGWWVRQYRHADYLARPLERFRTASCGMDSLGGSGGSGRCAMRSRQGAAAVATVPPDACSSA